MKRTCCYESERGRGRGSDFLLRSDRVSGEPEVLPEGRRNATTIFHSFSAFDHFPVAMSCMPYLPFDARQRASGVPGSGRRDADRLRFGVEQLGTAAG